MKVLTALTASLLMALTVQDASAAVETAQQQGAEEVRLAPAAKNVRLRKTLPGTERAISIAFAQYGRQDVAFVSSESGLQTFDVTDVDNPKFLDHLTKQEMALPGDDPSQRFWENEDINVDPKRKLAFLAREVNSFGRALPGDRPTGNYIVSAVNPADLKILSFHRQNTGHTSTCINDCQYLWTAGRDRSADNIGRIFVTDLRDPRNPKELPVSVDVRGAGKITHDVQVDAMGIAWVAGDDGTRGYWTDGWHRDPLTGKVREATAADPVPYAGGNVPKIDMPTRFTHNSFRPVGRTLLDGPRPTRENPAGSLLLHTEEAFGSSTCKDQGRFVISSLQGTENGEGWGSTPKEMKTVGVWSPDDQEGTLPGNVTCSAHYFDVQNRVVAYSWYEQGTRFIDISNPAKPIQIGYWRPDAATSWAPYWHKGNVFVADIVRGVEIVSLTKGAYEAQESGTNVQLVTSGPVKVKLTADTPRRLPLMPHPDYGYACPMIAGRDSGSCSPSSCC
ncbi:hypothetical protein LWC34_55350 [Kibdelosporangium philippinense]|uniref:LVIVD repeat-containing protein n=1 Tax=Kibdelosporangium philippinense TaxID=211113 RepID=A0ABS8ZWD1_9PSEU|nr:hypothetical protein [Kibdelosporangium philippinense]MCE7011932.1 hypothetical protein [Kibdelosporangium philippinense]